jgi:hypothetical protein
VNVSNAPVVTTPHYLELDGIDDYLQVDDSNALSFIGDGIDTAFTLEAWVHPDAMTRHQLISKWGEGSAQEYRLHISSGVIRLDLRDRSANAVVSVFTGSQTALIGSWHHLAVTYDGRGGATAANGINIYVDGVIVAVSRMNHTAYVAMENTSAPLQIGREGPSWKQFDGGLDEVRLWNLARTPSEIESFKNTEISGVEPGLVAYWRFNEGNETLVADDSQLDHTATLFNGPIWVPGGPMGPAEPDVAAPQITNIVISNLTATGVTITFTTSESATAWVSYTASGACPCTDTHSASPGTSHVVTLSGLAFDTPYTFEVRATDAASNLAVSATMTYRTLAPPPDTTAPVVTMVRPIGGNVTGTVLVEANATDLGGIVSVRFKINGANLGAPDTTAPYTAVWETSAIADGIYTVTAEARDAADNFATVTVLVNVANNVVVTPHSVDFDGVNDYVQVSDANSLSFGNGSADSGFTIEAWIRPDTTSGSQQLLGKWNGANAEYKLHMSAGFLRLDLGDASVNAIVSAFTTTSQAVLVGSWHHVAVTYDGRGGVTAANGINIYVDGVASALNRINHSAYVAMENLSAAVQIGREGPSWKQYNGGLDEVRVWNVARSADQIQSAMYVSLSGAEAGLMGYWRFNEGAAATAADLSPFGNAATLVNGTVWMPGGAPVP